MSWTRLDDGWTDDPIVNELSHDDRWHYIALIQFCSRTRKYDGCVRYVDAKRCSDHPDPDLALKNMHALRLVTIDGDHVKLNRLEEHIPPPSIRDNAKNSRIRMQRMRKHAVGDQSESMPDCEKAVTRDVTAPVTRNTRTGQDRTGSLTESSSETEKRDTSEPSTEAVLEAEEEVKQACPDCTDELPPDGICRWCGPRKDPLTW